MEPTNHYEAVVLAAGMSCVYNADDWNEHAANDPGDNAAESSPQY